MPQNTIQHIEWTTRDAQRLRSFFARIFDWEFREAMPDYTLIEGVGGILAAPDPQMPLGVTPYVNVTDLGVTEKRITEAGGRVHKSRQEVPGMGWFTIFSDPDGNMLALWQPAQKPRASRARAAGRKAAARKRPAKSGKKTAPRRAKGRRR